MMTAKLLYLAAATGLAFRAAPAPVQPPPPKLVLLIAVDQLRPDYFARWEAQLTGGLGRLYRGGTVYEHGRQSHAITETAPGHSTLLSGREPAHTGIVLNSRGVADSSAPLLGVADVVGASPARFQGTTLVDWLRAADSAARVLSVSRKDRGAILPIGRTKTDVYWYAGGRFTTSRYYADSLPPWVTAFNARRGPEHLAGTSWQTLLPASAYAERDSFWFENAGSDVAFPHRLPGIADSAARNLASYPWMDSLTLDFALEGARQRGLGRRDGTDALAISLSTTDAVGHAFGPDSREMHDQIVRLDRWLGWFLDSLGTMVLADRMVVVLTSDHGVQSYPEYVTAIRHRRAGRVWLGDLANGAAAKLKERYGIDGGLAFDAGLLMADLAALRAKGVSVDSLAAALAAEARTRPGVAKVYTPATLAQAPATDREAELWRRQLPARFGWLLCASPEPDFAWSSGGSGADHGSTNLPDVEVPIVFAGPGIPARHVARPVNTVDIAPTLARLLGLRPVESLDGVPLGEVVGTPAQ